MRLSILHCLRLTAWLSDTVFICLSVCLSVYRILAGTLPLPLHLASSSLYPPHFPSLPDTMLLSVSIASSVGLCLSPASGFFQPLPSPFPQSVWHYASVCLYRIFGGTLPQPCIWLCPAFTLPISPVCLTLCFCLSLSHLRWDSASALHLALSSLYPPHFPSLPDTILLSVCLSLSHLRWDSASASGCVPVSISFH